MLQSLPGSAVNVVLKYGQHFAAFIDQICLQNCKNMYLGSYCAPLQSSCAKRSPSSLFTSVFTDRCKPLFSNDRETSYAQLLRALHQVELHRTMITAGQALLQDANSDSLLKDSPPELQRRFRIDHHVGCRSFVQLGYCPTLGSATYIAPHVILPRISCYTPWLGAMVW